MRLLTEKTIKQLFHRTVKLPDSYFRKYEYLPACPLATWNNSWGDNDFPRVWCILDFREWIKRYDLESPFRLGFTCDTDPELEFLSPRTSTLVSYPPYDLHTVHKCFYNQFDFLLFNQTIEHLYNPFTAVQSIYRTVAPGGYVFASVPTLNIPHMTPFHFNGYTPMGLASLFTCGGFDIVEIGQWGCLKYIQHLWSTHKWPGYATLAVNNFVPNERNNVCQCWILARKPRSLRKRAEIALARLLHR
jgi:SAM-dependent methyltransferase